MQAKVQGEVSSATVSARIEERTVENALSQVGGHGDHYPGGKADPGVIAPPDPGAHRCNDDDDRDRGKQETPRAYTGSDWRGVRFVPVTYGVIRGVRLEHEAMERGYLLSSSRTRSIPEPRTSVQERTQVAKLYFLSNLLRAVGRPTILRLGYLC